MNGTYSLTEFFKVLDEIAPLSLSHKMIENGHYDNSGIIVKSHDFVTGAVFSLDLTDAAIKRAKSLGVDTIVTHHPAIYNPVKTLDVSGETSAVVNALKWDKNIISMHLNLDVADGGIDQSLCTGLGGNEYKILDYLDQTHGYGREFCVPPKKLGEFVRGIKKNFYTQKVICYGHKNDIINTCASFCGEGGKYAVNAVENGLEAEVIITSDLAHHQIKYLLDAGKSVIVIPHYVAEEYGFKIFYEKVNVILGKKLKLYYYDDKRFR